MTKDELLLKLDTNRDTLLAELPLKLRDMLTPNPQLSDWTGKDIVAHLARWNRVCADNVRRVLDGEAIPMLPGTSAELNARALAEDRTLSLEHARHMEESSYRQVRALVSLLSDEQLARVQTGPWLEFKDRTFPLYEIIGIDTYDHYAQHLADIRAAQSD